MALKKLSSFLLLILIVSVFASLLSAAAYADTSAAREYTAISGYETPASLSQVLTEKTYPWTLEADGSLRSGNSGESWTVSVLKISVKGSGALSFKYKVSSPFLRTEETGKKDGYEFNPDSLILWKSFGETGEAWLSEIYPKVDYPAAERYGMTRIYGEIDWTLSAVNVEAESDEQVTDIYFLYTKNGSTNRGSDCAWLKDISFSDGKVSITAVSNDTECGTVNGPTECFAGETVTLTAVPKEDCKFYGWNMDGRLVSSEAAYSFTVGEDVELTAIFGEAEAVVAQNVLTGYVYYNIIEAVENAAAGDSILVIKNTTISENAVIPDGVTLYIPYDGGFDEDGVIDGTSSSSRCMAADDKAYCTVTVDAGVTLEVKGTLRLGGEIGYPGQMYQGHTSGAHGKLVNNGTILVTDGGVLDCFGFIDGEGKVELAPGAKAYEPFVVFDFSGGSNTLELNKAGQSPFAQYTMQNIRCTFVINEGTTLFGRCNLYASSEFNKTDAPIIAGDGSQGLLSLKKGAVLTRTVDASKTVDGYCEDIGVVRYDISGGASFNSLTMKVLGVDITTEGVLFPIPYCYSYLLSKGMYEINTDIVLMPGTEMKVDSSAELAVHKRFMVLDGLLQNQLSGKGYPSTETLKNSGFATNGVLVVNGRMSIDGGVPFGGIIQTQRVGAEIITAENPITEDKTDYFANTVTLGAKAAYGDNTTVMPLDGRICSGGKLTKLEAGKTYAVSSAAGWTLPGYKVSSYTTGTSLDDVVINPATVITTDQSMSGEFAEAAYENYAPGDINGDGYVDAIDLTRLAKSFAGLASLSNESKAAADVNGDGAVDAIDLTRFAKYFAGLVSKDDLGKKAV